MVFAVIKTGGKQFSVAPGDRFVAERLSFEKEGGTLAVEEVLALQTKDKHLVGKPIVEGASVDVTQVRDVRHPKVLIFKKKRRHNYRRLKGHRQDGVLLQVADIKLKGQSIV